MEKIKKGQLNLVYRNFIVSEMGYFQMDILPADT